MSVRRLWELLSSPLLSQRYYVPLLSMFSLVSSCTLRFSAPSWSLKSFTHCTSAAEMYQLHAFRKIASQDMHIYRFSMLFRTNVSDLLCLVICEMFWFIYRCIFIHGMNSLICLFDVHSRLSAAVFACCVISQIFLKCETAERRSGLSKCDMCLMHLFLHSQLGAAYVSATTGAVVTALGLKSLATVMALWFKRISR